MAVAAAIIAAAPLVAVIVLAIVRPADAAMPAEVIWRYAGASAMLAGLVAVGSGLLGAIAAWLVVMFRFPGRDVFAWALALPLAAPAFAIAYGYADLFDVAGPIRTLLRDTWGVTAWPLEMRSLAGAAIVFSFGFYPYVYLTMRAAFVSQSVCALEAARTLGAGPFEAFRRVALPMARPALVAGMALAVMETLADYGAVQFLGVQTLTTGVVRAWSIYGAPGSAARLALLLMGAAAVLLLVERLARRDRGFAASSARWRSLVEIPLSGPAAWAAAAYCALLIFVGLLLPAGWLAFRAVAETPEWDRLARAALVSLGLGGAGALLTVLLAAAIAFGARDRPLVGRIASLGYATPGAVMAVGLLAPAALLWQGGLAIGAMAGLVLLVFAYAARLMAAGLEPIDAGLSRLSASMLRAPRVLGETEAGGVRRVQLPLITGAVWTAGLLVFVDILKELPATLILRPFNFDTLAVLADRYAADERLGQAALPALAVVLVALPAVVALSGRVRASRPGASS